MIDRQICFHVQLTSVTKFEPGQRVIFDQIDVNDGDGYANGTFTAPRAGLYYFAVTVTARYYSYVGWHLTAKGKVYAKILADTIDLASDSATGQAVIELESGQTVTVNKTALIMNLDATVKCAQCSLDFLFINMVIWLKSRKLFST